MNCVGRCAGKGGDMARAMSGPERRFASLVFRHGITELTANDGADNPKHLHLSDDGRGTTVIKGGVLFSDYPPASGKSPKNYKQIRPDFLLAGDFVEVKGNISAHDWPSLSRDALNDNLRLALLRMNSGCVGDIRKEYKQLSTEDQRIVQTGLRNSKGSPTNRHYLLWSDLVRAITSPGQNLSPFRLALGGSTFPVKVVAGMERFPVGRLFIVDKDLMSRW
jgi:hypothetical protein